MKVALVGTRGVPARYGGFETAVEEVGRRLAAAGVEVVVYCRNDPERRRTYLGMDLVHLPALRHRYLETLSHTFVSVLHLLWRPCDAVILFNGANSILTPLLLLRGIPTAVHVDGLESKRGKWSKVALAWHRMGERLATRFGNRVIADAVAIQDYYAETYGASTTLLTYGAPIVRPSGVDRLEELDLTAGRYHLLVARFERENNVDLIITGYRQADATFPLVVVGSASYPSSYEETIDQAWDHDPHVRMLGAVWDQELLDQLYAGSATYLHGHSVGGTNPSLLRAMGAGAPVLAIDVVFTREVLGDTGVFFHDEGSLSKEVLAADRDAEATAARGEAGRERAAALYRWDDVADAYRGLCEELTASRARRRLISRT